MLAFRDYCLERLDEIRKKEPASIDCYRPTGIKKDDEWTLEYINITRLQAVIEAFDDDTLGFITVIEINAFAASKPRLDWRYDVCAVRCIPY